MQRSDIVRQLVQEWRDRASEDLGVAEFLLDGGARFPGSIVFHAQQTAEKCWKALLVHFQAEFRKTHDIVELLDRVGAVDRPLADSLAGAAVLNPYGVEVRYPGDYPPVTTSDV